MPLEKKIPLMEEWYRSPSRKSRRRRPFSTNFCGVGTRASPSIVRRQRASSSQVPIEPHDDDPGAPRQKHDRRRGQGRARRGRFEIARRRGGRLGPRVRPRRQDANPQRGPQGRRRRGGNRASRRLCDAWSLCGHGPEHASATFGLPRARRSSRSRCATSTGRCPRMATPPSSATPWSGTTSTSTAGRAERSRLGRTRRRGRALAATRPRTFPPAAAPPRRVRGRSAPPPRRRLQGRSPQVPR